MSKYLYGAAVQGIQNFIFQTNTLREIVGASELVEEICTKLFAEQLGSEDLENDDNAILRETSSTSLMMKTSAGKYSENFRKEFSKPHPESQ